MKILNAIKLFFEIIRAILSIIALFAYYFWLRLIGQNEEAEAILSWGNDITEY